MQVSILEATAICVFVWVVLFVVLVLSGAKPRRLLAKLAANRLAWISLLVGTLIGFVVYKIDAQIDPYSVDSRRVVAAAFFAPFFGVSLAIIHGAQESYK